jgi:DNA polymerase-1
MAQAYLLDERTEKNEGMLNLDTLIRLNFGFNLKAVSIGVNRKDMLKTPLDDLLKYNALDAKYTYLLYKKQLPLINGYNNIIYKDLIKTATTLAVTQSRGITPDMYEVRKYSKLYGIKLIKLSRNIKSLPEIILYESNGKEFNPLSPDQVVFIIREILNIPGLKKTNTGKDSTDDKVLEELNKKGLKLAGYILEYRTVNKLKSTYVDNVRELRINNVIYPNFSHLFTKTGRFSGGKE